jgi:hypothetical protein
MILIFLLSDFRRRGKHPLLNGSKQAYLIEVTMLQGGMLKFRFPMRHLILNLPIPSSRTMAVGSTENLTDMNARNLCRNKAWLVRKADNLTATCE